MRLVEDRIRELEKLDVQPTKRPDYDEFWKAALDQVARLPLNARIEPVDYPLDALAASDVTYDGLDGTPIKAWLVLPKEPGSGPRPIVVRYHGYGWWRGYPSHHAAWVAMGYAVLAVDTRLQGNDTGSNSGAPTGHVDAGMTLGLLDKEAYYLRHTYTDSLRAIRLARELPGIDPKRVVVEGGSQGGGLSIAMAGLVPDVSLCLADVPSYGWIEKRIFDRSGTFGTVAGVIRRHPDWMEKICATLSYYDTLNLADRIKCPTCVSVGLKDPVCPADTVYAVYNRIRAPKRIDAYPFGEHDGGGSFHEERKYAFVRERMP